MHIRILGAAAGGGFPQWNCNGRLSARVRRGDPGLKPRTQSSLAVSANGSDWVLLNASPDLRQQINDTPALWPAADGPKRASPIKAVVVTNADVDHIIGLVNLREAQPFSIYASERVMATLDANSVFNVLARDKVARIVLPTDQATELTGAGIDLGLAVEAFNVPGKVALYLEGAQAGGNFGSREGDTIGLHVKNTRSGKSFFYVPGCAEVDPPLASRLKGADLLFFDGTLFTDDEMLTQGLLNKTGKRMGHISVSGDDGSIAAFRDLGISRKIYVHINNSNPMLDDTSAERRLVEAAQWEVGYDGMEISL
ncbi:MAG: pyrroloquinoline quinone biosynthesis protein PqqB [Hyphomicrobiaceae bacterium]|nr:pyrroloquinoline quinone biosynthesis protein PqqB [Hyphomicrobiaceae bacterium]